MARHAPLRWVAFAALCLAALLAAPLASAAMAPFEARLDVDGTVRFQGESRLAVQAGAILHHPALSEGVASLEASTQGLRLQILNYSYQANAVLGSVQYANRLPHEAPEDGPFAGTIRWSPSSANHTAYLMPVGQALPLRLDCSCRLDLSAPVQLPSAIGFFGSSGLENQIARERLQPEGSAAFLHGDAWPPLRVEDDVRLVVFGGAVHLADGSGERVVDTGDFLDPARSVRDPSGNLRSDWHDQVVLVAEGPMQAVLSGSAWDVAARRVAGTLEGDLEVASANGTTRLAGQDTLRRSALVQAIGEFAAEASWGGGPGQWTLEGEASFVGFDAVAAHGQRTLLAAIWVAGGLTLAGALAWVSQMRPPGVAGYNRATAFGHPVRASIARLIQEEPGIGRAELGRRLGLGRATLRHHIAILQRDEVVIGGRFGMGISYILNHDAYRFAAAAAGAPIEPRPLAPVALAARRHPVRRLILEALAEGEADYAAACGRWRRLGAAVPGRTVFSYHAARLAQAGLVRRRRDGTRTVWAVAVDIPATIRHGSQVHRPRDGPGHGNRLGGRGSMPTSGALG